MLLKYFKLFSVIILSACLFSCSAGSHNNPPNADAETPTDTLIETEPEVLSSIIEGENWRYFKGSQAPDTSWGTPEFDDSTWLVGASGFGYGDADDATVLDDMAGAYLSVYTRKLFQYSSSSTLTSMTLTIDYDDAFIAYLNGVEVVRSGNLPSGSVAFNTAALSTREAGTAVNFDMMSFVDNLREGENVFAIEVHNQSLNSSDLSLIARIYFNEAPPSNPNNGGGSTSTTRGSLSDYTVVGDLNSINFIVNDLSGITYAESSNSYFLIQNNGGKIWEVDTNFSLIRTIQMSNSFGDTEDIVYMGNNEFAIVNEASKLFIVTIMPNTTTLNTTDTTNVQTIIFAENGGNAGPEGVAFNPTTQTFYIVKEQSPKVIYSFQRPSSGNQTITPNIPFNAETVLAMLNDLSAITYDPRGDGSLLILSHLSHAVVDIDISGTIAGVLTLADTTQHEGITLDNNFNLQITSEANYQRTYSPAP